MTRNNITLIIKVWKLKIRNYDKTTFHFESHSVLSVMVLQLVWQKSLRYHYFYIIWQPLIYGYRYINISLYGMTTYKWYGYT